MSLDIASAIGYDYNIYNFIKVNFYIIINMYWFLGFMNKIDSVL